MRGYNLGYPCCWKKNQHSNWRKYLSEKYPGVALKILPCSLFHDLMHFSGLLLCLLLHHPITLLLSSKFVKRTPIYGHKINQAIDNLKKKHINQVCYLGLSVQCIVSWTRLDKLWFPHGMATFSAPPMASHNIIIIDILKSIGLPCWAETNNCIFGYNLNNYYTGNWRCNLSRKNYRWTPLEREQRNCQCI